MEHLSMSRKERTRLEVFSRVKAGQITRVKAAALLGLSYRQTLRAYRRYAKRGAAGLTHGLRGKPGNRGHDRSHRQKVLAAYRRSYGDFGPTLAAEQMAARDDLAVDHETLRRWLVGEGLWKGSRKRQQHRSRRERKEHAGELVQLDGSPHDWLEGRGPRLTLIEFVDDATGRAYGRFYPEETTEAVMDCLGRYARRHGLPRALYVDKDSIYTVNNRQASGAEILAGKEPRTQFARAMEELGVEIILANSPQAKGRVERVHGTHQDRLVKLMRLAGGGGGGGITTMEQANAYLEDHYWGSYNAKFAVAAAEPADLHRPTSTKSGLAALDGALCVKEARTVGRDWCICYERRVLQVAARHQSLGLAGRRVEVRAQADGRLALWFNGRALEHRELSAAAAADRPVPAPARSPIRNNKAYKPSADHPYRQGIEARVGVPPGSSATPQTPAAPRSTNVTLLTS
jgi:transposase